MAKLHFHHVPVLREMHNLRNEGVARLALQAAFVGAGSGAVIGMFRMLYDHGNTWVVNALARSPNTLNTALIVFSCLIFLALAVGWLVRKEPLISGSGIPQMELALSGQIPFPWLRVVIYKFIGTLMSLTGGLSVGREGPSIQMGAAVGCGFGILFRRISGSHTAGTPRFLIAGSVAGLTAAFGAPIAGMLFAFEEVKAIVSVPLLLFTGISAASAWFVIKVLFGFELVFPFATIHSLPWAYFWLTLPLGILFGIAGAAYNCGLVTVTRIHDQQKLIPAPLKPLIPFLLAGILLYIYPQVLVGVGITTADLAGLTPRGQLGLDAILLLLCVKVGFSILSFASGVPGGLLMPMLAIGSMSGCLAGSLIISTQFSSAEFLPVFLVLGMTGLFSSTVRAPLTGAALVAEMCGSFQCLPEMLVVSVCATFTANFMGSPPIYNTLKTRILLLRNARSYISTR